MAMNEEKFLKCIVDNNRRQILKCLDQEEKSVTEITNQTNLEQSLVSFHLKSLRNCGLVYCQQKGKKRMYKVSNPKILEVIKKIKNLSSEIQEECKTNVCE